MLTIKDLKVRYKEAVLGVAWAIVVPLITMFIFAFVFSRFAKFNTGAIPYPIFVYCGILPWTFFSTTLTSATEVLILNDTLITKANFPKEVLPLSTIFSNLVDFLIGLGVFFILIIFYKVHIGFHIFWILPILFIQIILLVGLALLLSVANLYYRDVKYIFQVLIILWMFLTPVFYPLKLLLSHRWLVYLNPMASIVPLYRFSLGAGALPPKDTIIAGIFLSLFIASIGMLVFSHLERYFAKII